MLPLPRRSPRRRSQGFCVLALGLFVAFAGRAAAQEGARLTFSETPPVIQPESPAVVPGAVAATPSNPDVKQAGCIGCGNGGGLVGGSGLPAVPGDGCGCNGGLCYPGRTPCYPCEAHTVVGRFLCGLYACVCCPDPCYEGKWKPIADTAFFTDSARPQTQTRFRVDNNLGVELMDRAEYLWARDDGKGKGPMLPAGRLAQSGVRFTEVSMYVEGATGLIGVYVETPYRSVDTDSFHAAGFGDVTIGTKTLLFDCELLQIALQMKTTLPAGISTKGLGTGHVSLEPGLIFGFCVGPETFLQAQVAEWIPLGGDNDYSGAVLKYSMSLNHTLWRPLPDVPLIATAEFAGLSFQDGLYTDPILGPIRAGDHSYFSVGPALRLFVCNRIDFGLGAAFAVGDQHLANVTYRSEFRFRF